MTNPWEEISLDDYSLILQEPYPLPNGKALVRLDFERNEVIVHGK